MRKWAMIGAVALTAGCATGHDSTAEAQCQYFAREEGFEWVRTVKSAPAGGGTGVTMEVKDALSRPFTPTCVVADGKKRWLEPLPSNAIQRQEGRDNMAPRPAK